MATADSVKAKMQGLIDSANAKTGGNDTTLTAAVNRLIAGYGSGGGSSGSASGIYMAKITPEEDINSLYAVHNLGTTDILLACCWAETLGDTVPSFNGALGKFWTKTDIANQRAGVGNNTHAVWNTSNSYVNLAAPASLTYWDEIVDENTFRFARSGSSAAQYIAGVTYTIIIIAANAEV